MVKKGIIDVVEYKKSVFDFLIKINSNFAEPIFNLDPHNFCDLLREYKKYECYAFIERNKILGLSVIEIKQDKLLGVFLGKLNCEWNKEILKYANEVLDCLQKTHKKDTYTISYKNRKAHKAYLRAISIFYNFQLEEEDHRKVVLVRKLKQNAIS